METWLIQQTTITSSPQTYHFKFNCNRAKWDCPRSSAERNRVCKVNVCEIYLLRILIKKIESNMKFWSTLKQVDSHTYILLSQNTQLNMCVCFWCTQANSVYLYGTFYNKHCLKELSSKKIISQIDVHKHTHTHAHSHTETLTSLLWKMQIKSTTD